MSTWGLLFVFATASTHRSRNANQVLQQKS